MYRFALIKFLPVLAVLVLISCNKDGGTNPVTNSQTLEQGYNSQYVIILSESKIDEISGSAGITAKVQSILADHQIASKDLMFIYDVVVHGFAVRISYEKALELGRDSRVSYVEADKEIKLPADEVPQLFADKQNTIQTQSVPWGITTVGYETYTGTNIAWILDTGVDLNHSDLNPSARCTTFVSTETTPQDYNGHGTHVAGIIAAKNNTIGVVGVAAGATVRAVKVLDRNGSGYISEIVAGINYVGANATSGDVVNMSFGGGRSTTLDNAVYNLGTNNNRAVYISLAAGNSSANATYYSPARVNATRIFTVSAHDSRNRFASWSNYGNPPIDWCAPGVSITSTFTGNRYASMSGTSMAAPHVAGILLSTGGTINSRGNVTGDRDNSADRMARR